MLELRLREERARLSSLRHQVNPHFLFNALNSIYAALPDNGAGSTAPRKMLTRLAALAEHTPDVVFLDIRLRGEIGFDFLAAAPKPLPAIIFVTAYDQFAIRAFECNAMDYLLKPVEPERLALSLDRVRQGISPPASPMTGADSVFIKDGQIARLVPWAEIFSIQSDGNYTRLSLSDGTRLYVQRTLKTWVAQAPESILLQIHRSTLVQKAAIQSIETIAPKHRKLTLKNGEAFEISRNFWLTVKAAIEA